MAYAKIVNGAVAAYPYTLADLRRDNPQVSYPADPGAWLTEHGIEAVTAAAPPSADPTKNVAEGTPALVNGVWTQVWEQHDASAEEIAARQRAATDDTDRTSARADAFVKAFLDMTPADVAAYIDANATSLATARDVLKKYGIILQVVARQALR